MDYSSAFSFESAHSYKSSFKFPKLPNSNRHYQSLVNNLDEENPSQPLISIVFHYVVVALAFLAVVLTAPLSFLLAFKLVQDQDRLLVFRLGRFRNMKGPGLVFILPFVDKITKVDLRVKAFHIPPMLISMNGGGSISVGATVMYSVKDPVTATLSLQDPNHTIRTLGQAVMYHGVNKYSMEQLRRNRNDTNALLKRELSDAVLEWGLEIYDVELSHITELSQPPTAVEDVQEKLGSIMSQMGGIQGLVSAATTFLAEGNYGEIVGHSPQSVTEKFHAKILESLDDSLVDSVGCSYHFVVLQPNETNGSQTAREYFLNCKRKPVSFVEADDSFKPFECDVKVTITLEDLIDLVRGNVSGTSLYLRGRVTVEGDMSVLDNLSAFTDRIGSNLDL